MNTTIASTSHCTTHASDTRSLGAFGEQVAAEWLESRGCRILDRNWRTRYGELDIVAVDPQGVIVFVEVKTRRSTRYGLPQESVTAAKRTHLRRAAVQWLIDPDHRVPHRGTRFDVIAITVDAADSASINCIEGAF